jgi:hypothetical protein
MNLVGSLLISALIIFPSLSAMRVFKSFRSVIICSAVISVICAAVGILASILLSTPVGSTIVTADIAVLENPIDAAEIYNAVNAGASNANLSISIGDREFGRALKDLGVAFQ